MAPRRNGDPNKGIMNVYPSLVHFHGPKEGSNVAAQFAQFYCDVSNWLREWYSYDAAELYVLRRIMVALGGTLFFKQNYCMSSSAAYNIVGNIRAVVQIFHFRKPQALENLVDHMPPLEYSYYTFKDKWDVIYDVLHIVCGASFPSVVIVIPIYTSMITFIVTRVSHSPNAQVILSYTYKKGFGD